MTLAIVALVKVLLITGASDEPYHHWRQTSASIRQALEHTGKFDVKTTEEPRALNDAALKDYDVVVVNYNGARWGPVAEKAVENFVRSGKGLVAFHLATYGPFFGQRERKGGGFDQIDRGWLGWSDMIGATWKAADIGHAPRGPFTIRWLDKQHAIAAGTADWSANDELYHKVHLSTGAKVLADAHSSTTGKREPLIWTNEYGSGRVFYTTLGHDAAAWHQRGMSDWFARGVEWAATGAVAPAPEQPRKIRMLVVTSGHSYPMSFYSMLHDLPNVQWNHAASHTEIPADIAKRYDVVLLHDMHDEIEEKPKTRLQTFVENGGGIVSLHHAAVNYTSWPWWYQEVIGGKYFVKDTEFHRKSSYHEDVDFVVNPVKGKEKHPVLEGVPTLSVHDELYRNMWHSPKIDVLMETTHPENDRPVVYVGPHPKARVVYIQLGHSDHTMRHPGFRRLVSNAIRWTARHGERQ